MIVAPQTEKETPVSKHEKRGAAAFPAQTLWAIREDVLPTLEAIMEGALSQEEARERLGLSKAAAQTSQVAGGSVAVISLQGVITPRGGLLSMLLGIGGGGLQGFRTSFREALSDESVSSVLLVVDSPGGLIDLVPETAAEIRGARGTKPIVAIANTDAASAAYWIASQADELVVTPSGQVGSIGVFVRHEDFSRMDEMMGVKTTLIRAGKFKAEANPFEPLNDAAKGHLQETVDDLYGMFVADVAAGRGVKAADVKGGYGEGRMVLAKDAVAEGMADREATFEETVASMTGESSPGSRAQALAPQVEAEAPEAEAEAIEPVVEAPEPEAEVEVPAEVAAEAPEAEMSEEDRRRLVDVLLD